MLKAYRDEVGVWIKIETYWNVNVTVKDMDVVNAGLK